MPTTRDIPEFLAQRLDDAYDADTVARIRDGFRAACDRPVTLRANTLRAGADEGPPRRFRTRASLDASQLVPRRLHPRRRARAGCLGPRDLPRGARSTCRACRP